MLGLLINKGEYMDKYTKFILTIIAVGILGLNYHLIKGDIISEANAANTYIGEWPNQPLSVYIVNK